jgi:hypothetical protein
MEFEVMKKKLDGFRKANGQFKKVSGELLVELLRMWESHTGESSEFAKRLGMRSKQLGSLIREGRKVALAMGDVSPAFHAVGIEGGVQEVCASGSGIEMSWGGDKVIRFPSVDVLWDFLKKAA